MEEQFNFFLNQINNKLKQLFDKIDRQETEIKELRTKNNELAEALRKQINLNEKLQKEKLENEINIIAKNKNKKEKETIINNIDETIRVIDKTIMLLNK